MNIQLARNFKSYFVESRFISFIVAIIIIALRLLMFINKGLPQSSVNGANFVWPYIEVFFQQNPLISFALSTFSVFIVSYLISELNVRYGIMRVRTYMPFYIPLILFSIHPFFLTFTPSFVSLMFILGALFPLLASYQNLHSHRFAFQFGALIAIAGAFQVYALLLLPLWLIGLSVMGEINFRSIVSSVFGMILVFWIIFALFVFDDNIAGFAEPFTRFVQLYDYRQPPVFTLQQWAFISISLVFVFFFLIADSYKVTRERSFTKKALRFATSVIIVSLLLQILYLGQTQLWIYVIAAFLSLTIAHFYTFAMVRTEILSYFLLLALFIFCYGLNFFTDLSPF